MGHLARGFAFYGQHLGVGVRTSFAHVADDQPFRTTHRRIADRVMVDRIRAVSGAAVAGVPEEPGDVGPALLVRFGRAVGTVGRRQHADARATGAGAATPRRRAGAND